MSKDALDVMKEFVKEKNVSFVFECVDMERDPHIIEYDKSGLFLLDIIKNDMEFLRYPFDDMCNVAHMLGLEHKKKAAVLNNWQEFYDWYFEIMDEDYKYHEKNIEGFVIEDSRGYMVKRKITYYSFWKFMRGVAHSIIRYGQVKQGITSALTTPLANKFYGWVKEMKETGSLSDCKTDICTLRKMFLESERGADFINK